MRSRNAIRNLITLLSYEAISFILGIVFPRFVISIYGSEINGLTSTITRILSLINLIQAGAVGTAIYQMYKPVATNDFETQSAIIYTSRKFYNRVAAVYLALSFGIGIFYSFYLESNSLTFLSILLSFGILATNGASILLFNSICCPEEIAYKNDWISKETLLEQGHLMEKNQYGQHLLNVANGKIKY